MPHDIVLRMEAAAEETQEADNEELLNEGAREIARLREALSSETAAREKAERERLQLARSLNATARARNEADDRLADLTRKLEVAAGALEPFAKCADDIERSFTKPLPDDLVMTNGWVKLGECRRAREARAAILGEEKS